MEPGKDEDFLGKLYDNIQVSKKNTCLYSKYKASETEKTEVCSFEEAMHEQFISNPNHFTSSFSISDNPKDCLNVLDPLFLYRPSILKKLIKFPPKVALELKSSESCSSLFELARQQAYLGLIPEALRSLTQASNLEISNKYEIWKILLYTRNPKYIQLSLRSCCGSRKLVRNKDRFFPLFTSLIKLPSSLETLWILMEMSFTNMLTVGKYLEPWQYYASKIMEIEKYYGYLSWGIYNTRCGKALGRDILHELIEKYPRQPEAYIVLWDHYYCHKDYLKSYDTVAEAFLRITDEKYSNFSVLILILYSKSLFKLNRFFNALEVLQEKYLDNCKNIRFLYQFGKLCVKSDVKKFLGTGLGALKEVSRLVKDYPKLYFWLGKACYLTGRILKAKKYFEKLASMLPIKELKLHLKIREKLEKINKTLKEIENIKENLDCEVLYEVYQKESSLMVNALKLTQISILIKSGNKPSALEMLKKLQNYDSFLCILDLISTYPFEEANDLLIESLEGLSIPQIPTHEFVRACIKYANFLGTHKLYDKSMGILRSLIKFYPHYDTEMNYCRNILNSENLKSLPVIGKNTENTFNNYYKNRAYVLDCIREKKYDSKNFIIIETLDNSGCEVKENFVYDKNCLSPRRNYSETEFLKTLKNKIASFSVYTGPDILMAIAEIAVKANGCKAEALMALEDYLVLAKKPHQRHKAEKFIESLFN
ncbi:hypothetical protein SteCoe_27568 [Stentor coeruleus]|uniref:Uncharacterized protein n=1 Tax=Stentor coeruleus TaxID=5963 RepID=A0A1R2BA88_9CILI|nr:hypothetical protein SteCoe_27568 [Stentor coeruleus]